MVNYLRFPNPIGHIWDSFDSRLAFKARKVFTRQSVLFIGAPKQIFHITLISVYKNCADYYKAGQRISGVYRVDPDNTGAFDVYCDQTTAGGGWAVFQKRLDGSVDFDRVWKDYKQGFGSLSGEFWLGLDKVHRLTKEQSKLRVELEDFNGQTAYAEYDLFGVADEGNKYRLTLGTYAG